MGLRSGAPCLGIMEALFSFLTQKIMDSCDQESKLPSLPLTQERLRRPGLVGNAKASDL